MNTKFIFWLVLLIFYVFILSFNLLTLPLYLDEGIYIFWSYLFSDSPGFAYVSMQDGKTPLFIWLTSFINQFFNNFLFSGRFISVLASAVSLICCAIITGRILGYRKSYFIPILFLVTPFSVLISRLAFVDSLLIAFGSLSILGIFLLQESSSRKQIFRSLVFALLTGISLGLAFFAKTTAKIFFAVEMFILMIWVLQFIKQKNFRGAGLLIIGIAVVAGLYFELLGYLKFGALRHWEMIANKESVLIFSLSDLYQKFSIQRNFGIHISNLSFWFEYLFVYFGPILLFFAAGVVWIFKQRKHVWILLVALILAAGVLLSAKIPASRYLAIIIPEVLIISAFGLFWIWQKKSKPLKIISVLLLIVSGFFSFRMVFTPLNAYYSHDDQGNFLDTHLSALGLNESVEYLLPRKDISAVAVTGIWGVSEGAQVAFKEKGIETYSTGKVVDGLEKEKEFCEENYQELEGKCWKIDFGDVVNSVKPEKYVYFMSNHIDIETLQKLTEFEVIKEFRRVDSTQNVYLIRLIGSSEFSNN